MVIRGMHAIFYTTDAEATRAFLRDKLDLPHYDAAAGWPLFMASGDIGCHPAGAPRHELSFFCDDLDATMSDLVRRGVTFTQPVIEEEWGWRTFFDLPGAGDVQLYQPKYERPAG